MSTRRILKKDDERKSPFAPAPPYRPALGSTARPQLADGTVAQRRPQGARPLSAAAVTTATTQQQRPQRQQSVARREGCWQAWLRRLGLTLCCSVSKPRRSRNGEDTSVRARPAASSSLPGRLRESETAGSTLCETARLYDAGGFGSEDDGASSCDTPRRDATRQPRPAVDRRGGWRYSDTASTSSSTSSLRSTSYFRSEESVSSTNSRYSSAVYSDDKSCASSCAHTSSMNASNEGTYWSPQQQHGRKHGRRLYNRGRDRRQDSSLSSSSSSCSDSMTDSSLSLNVITVTLNTDATNFLGISIVGQSGSNGDGGIYVGSVMPGGAVDIDGRIEAGDMILEVNGQSFDRLSNDEAVHLLRDAVRKPGSVTLVVAKCWEVGPLMTSPAAAREADRRGGAFLTPRQEPVRPIDPLAWVAHTTALQSQAAAAAPPTSAMPLPAAGTGSAIRHRQPPAAAVRAYDAGRDDGAVDSASTCSSGDATLLPDAAYGASPRFAMDTAASVRPDAAAIVAAMARPDSGLDVRDRTWLKVTIPSAFIGSDLVDWLLTRVQGFIDRSDACSYAAGLLKAGHIQHTVNKEVFSEQCYYVFGSSPHGKGQHGSRSSYANVGCTGSPTDVRPPLLPPRRAVQQQQQAYAVSSLLRDSSQPSRAATSRLGDTLLGVDRPPNALPTSGALITSSTRQAAMSAPSPRPPAMPASSRRPPATLALPRPIAAVPSELTSSRASFHAAMENPWGRDLCSEEAV